MRAEIQKMTASKLRTAVALLYNNTEDSGQFKLKKFHNCKNETLSLVVIMDCCCLTCVASATPSTLTVEREQTPVMQCKGCLQGFHSPCLLLGQPDIARVPRVPTVHTAKPAERQKKVNILAEGLAKQSESQQCKFELESLLVPLTSNSLSVQASVV